MTKKLTKTKVLRDYGYIVKELKTETFMVEKVIGGRLLNKNRMFFIKFFLKLSNKRKITTGYILLLISLSCARL